MNLFNLVLLLFRGGGGAELLLLFRGGGAAELHLHASFFFLKPASVMGGQIACVRASRWQGENPVVSEANATELLRELQSTFSARFP